MKKVISNTVLLCIILSCIGCEKYVEKPPCAFFEKTGIKPLTSGIVVNSYAIPGIGDNSIVCSTIQDVSGIKIELMNIDESGNKELLYEEQSVTAAAIVQSPQDSSYTVCANKQNYIYLIHVSKDGEVLTKSFGDFIENISGCNSISTKGNNTYIIAGYIEKASNDKDAYIASVSIDSDRIEWNWDNSADPIKTGNDEILFARETQDGSIVGVGYFTTNEIDTYFLKYGSNGNLIAEGDDLNIKNEGQDRGTYIVEKDGGYLITGYFYNDDNLFDSYLLDLDRDGNRENQNTLPTFGGDKDDFIHFLYIYDYADEIYALGQTESPKYGASSDNPNLFLTKIKEMDGEIVKYQEVENGDKGYNGNGDVRLKNVTITPSFQYVEGCGFIMSGVTSNGEIDEIQLVRTKINGEI